MMSLKTVIFKFFGVDVHYYHFDFTIPPANTPVLSLKNYICLYIQMSTIKPHLDFYQF